jgi:hypothetical protein
MDQNIPHNHWIDKIALLNSVMSGLTLFPQLYVITSAHYHEGSLSTLSFGLILSNSLIWLWYGIHRRSPPLIISSFLNVIASSLILIII